MHYRWHDKKESFVKTSKSLVQPAGHLFINSLHIETFYMSQHSPSPRLVQHEPIRISRRSDADNQSCVWDSVIFLWYVVWGSYKIFQCVMLQCHILQDFVILPSQENQTNHRHFNICGASAMKGRCFSVLHLCQYDNNLKKWTYKHK